jgi:hypothetical protein
LLLLCRQILEGLPELPQYILSDWIIMALSMWGRVDAIFEKVG